MRPGVTCLSVYVPAAGKAWRYVPPKRGRRCLLYPFSRSSNRFVIVRLSWFGSYVRLPDVALQRENRPMGRRDTDRPRSTDQWDGATQTEHTQPTPMGRRDTNSAQSTDQWDGATQTAHGQLTNGTARHRQRTLNRPMGRRDTDSARSTDQ